MSTYEPLWRLMRHAYDQRTPEIDDQTEDRLGYAAEIRAIADALYQSWLPHWGEESVRAWFLEEADKAEAGE